MTANMLAVNAWAFEAHPEVWLLVGGIVGLGVYATRAIGPLVVPEGQVVVTRAQKRFFLASVVLLWIAADYPMHDIAEQYLYSVHMFQHLLIAFIVPPLLLLAMPEWLARLLVLDGGATARVLRVLTKPVVAGVIFNALQVLSHWDGVVNLSSENGPFHYMIHLAVFFSALLMWFPVLGPLKEVHLSEPAKLIYLFLMSIVPTVPAGWLTFAEGVVYDAYDHDHNLWGINPTNDQQIAGAIMKVVGGFYLWTLIAIRFFKHVAAVRRVDEAAKYARGRLTYDEVEAAFDAAGDPSRESQTH
ncbi:MAG: cytochrome c oxidase assembly protein [Acidimicrobiales bacterium]|jgi:putative membrane protein|nr:cytochrome c oxidase assembly protein [Acidimicrobiales bacterium]